MTLNNGPQGQPTNVCRLIKIVNLKTLIVRLFDLEAQRDDDPECKRVQLLRVQSPLSEFT